MDEIKKTCDGNCETCPDRFRLFCALTIVKRCESKLDSIMTRIDSIEQRLSLQDGEVITPKESGSFSPQANLNTETVEDE